MFRYCSVTSIHSFLPDNTLKRQFLILMKIKSLKHENTKNSNRINNFVPLCLRG